MRNKDNSIKSGLIVLCFLTGIIIVVTSSPDLNKILSRNFNNNITNIKSYVTEKLDLNTSSNKSNLVESYSEFYTLVEEALNSYKSSLNIAVKNYDKTVYNEEVFHKALENNPIAGPGFSCYITTQEMGSNTMVTFQFKYPEAREVLMNKDKAVKDKVKEIVASVVKPEMKDYEKEKVLHDYVVNNSSYDERLFSDDMPDESYTAYGLLIDGLGVCQGYAVAMNLLLNEAGVESMLITGDSWNEEAKGYISHAWNLVKLGGEYYHLDATWNDPVTDDGSDVLRYSYFNVTDDQIRKNHRWDKSKFPQCDSYEYSFNNLDFVEKDIYGNDIIAVTDYSEFLQSLEGDILAMKPNVTYKILNFDDNTETIKEYINKAYDNAGMEGECSFFYDVDEMFLCGYVTIEFTWN